MTNRQAKRRPMLNDVAPGRDGNPLDIILVQTDLDSGHHPANADESALGKCLHRKLIEGYMWAAGDRFRNDYELGETSALKAVEPQMRVQGGTIPGNLSDAKLDAQQRVNMALKSLNATSRIIVIKLCAEGWTYEKIRTVHGFNRDYIGPRAREALHDLALHYGLVTGGMR